MKENKTNVAHAESEKRLDRLVFSFLCGVLPSLSRFLRVAKCCCLPPHGPLIITVVLRFFLIRLTPLPHPVKTPTLGDLGCRKPCRLRTMHPTRFISQSLFQFARPPPPPAAAPASSGCSENRKFSFNSPPPSGPPVPSRSLGSTARTGPRCFAPEDFNLHTRRRVGPRPRGSQVPAPPCSLPASGPQSRPETRASPRAGGRAAPSLRPPSLRRCAHPLPAERGSPRRQSVTCSARRARAGADRQTDRQTLQLRRRPAPLARTQVRSPAPAWVG